MGFIYSNGPVTATVQEVLLRVLVAQSDPNHYIVKDDLNS